MTFSELLRAVDALSIEELRQLRERIEQRQREAAMTQSDALDRALAALREGLTEKQLDEIEWAMNVETLQPLDKSAWQE